MCIRDSYNTVFNAICAGAYADMAKLAEVLGYEGDRAYYQNLSDTIKNTLISKAVSYTHLDVYKRQHMAGRIGKRMAKCQERQANPRDWKLYRFS